jgi:hypothetical protein
MKLKNLISIILFIFLLTLIIASKKGSKFHTFGVGNKYSVQRGGVILIKFVNLVPV